MKCIFLGYSRFQRGYHCYSLDTHQYCVSVDVTLFNILLFSLPHCLPVPRSYLYLSSFSFCPYHPSPQLLHLVHYRFILVHYMFILVVRVSTPGLLMIRLLCHPSPRRWSCCLPLILPSPFGKVLVSLVILILFILSYLIIVYLHHILLLFSPCLLFLFLTLSTRPSLIWARNRQWLKKWLLCILLSHET